MTTTSFIGNITYIVETGHIFVIGGATTVNATRFEVTLKSGKHDNALIPLRLSVLFNEGIITRNSYLGNNSWNGEERSQNLNKSATTNPLVPGQNFQFYILVGETHFFIAVNKNAYCKYPITLPLEDIRTISLSGDVSYVRQIDHRASFPIPYPLVQVDDVESVFSNDVPGNFQPGQVIVITGTPYGNKRGRFILSFCEGDTAKEGLHFNPRFDQSENCVVRNAMDDNLIFGKEERSGKMPFAINHKFKLAIAFTRKEFLFAINGVYFNSFAYRTNKLLEKINGFKIYSRDGIHIEITSVDHVYMGQPDCYDFEQYSHPEIQIY